MSAKRELAARTEEIRETGNHLKQLSRKVWKRRIGFALSITGAVWAATGNPIGAALSIGGAILGFQSPSNEVGAYTYIFKARNRV